MPRQPKPPAVKTMELRFPSLGVVRAQSQERDYSAPAYPTPWACNCRLLDPIASRLRGGSRGGLTKFLASSVGTSIAAMIPIQIADTTGTREVLVVLVDETIGVVDGGSISFPTGALTDESGNYIVTEAGDKILLRSSDAPASAFIVAGNQHAYLIDSAGNVLDLNPKTGVLSTIEATAGTVPTGCTLGAVWRGRLVLAGGDNGVYLSKQGDFANWDFGVDVGNTGRAIPFQLSEAAEVGDACTALVACSDTHLLAATSRGLWVVRGDPAANGSLQNVSSHVGIIAKSAWCRAARQIVFLADDGLYHVSQDGSDLLPLSRGKLPEELRQIDTSTTTVLMGYDHETNAVHIYLTTAAGGDTHWLYEIEDGKFWPMRLQDDHAPVAVCAHDGQLLLAGSDGYLRSAGGDSDDGSAIESHLLIGPLRIGGATEYGLIQTIHGILGSGSGDVTWRIVTGDTAEEACDNGKAAIEAFQAGGDVARYVASTGVWGAGRSKTSWPRRRAVWCCLWLQSTAKWAMESALLEIISAGRVR